MTTAVPSRAIAAARAVEHRDRFGDLLAAEWIKLWSLRFMPWAFGLGALIVIGINLNATVTDYTNYPLFPPEIRDTFVPIRAMRDAFTPGAGLVLMLVAGGIGALTIVSEYSSGQIRTTFAAVPARRAVLAAKMTVVTACTLAYGAVVAGTSFGVTQAILSGRHLALPLGHPGVLRAIAASALLAPVCALVGLAIGVCVRHTAAAIATITGVLLLPSLLDERDERSAALLHALPRGAWDRLTEVGHSPLPVPHPASITGSWTVYAAWSLGAAAISMIIVYRRDL
ncbi:hypothetical protein [Streptosporangium sp. G12]